MIRTSKRPELRREAKRIAAETKRPLKQVWKEVNKK